MQDPVNRIMCGQTIDPQTGDVQTTHERKTKSGYLPVTIFNGRNKSLTFSFLIDTGSTNNWTAPQAFNIINNHAYSNRLAFTVEETNVTSQTGGNGDGMIKAQGKITIPVVLNFDCKKIPDDHITFYLLPSGEACILGEEVLDKYKGKIEFNGNEQKLLTVQEPKTKLCFVQTLLKLKSPAFISQLCKCPTCCYPN